MLRYIDPPSSGALSPLYIGELGDISGASVNLPIIGTEEETHEEEEESDTGPPPTKKRPPPPLFIVG